MCFEILIHFDESIKILQNMHKMHHMQLLSMLNRMENNVTIPSSLLWAGFNLFDFLINFCRRTDD